MVECTDDNSLDVLTVPKMKKIGLVHINVSCTEL